MMTDEQLKAKGWSVPIYKAVHAAGGPLPVAYAFGMKSVQGVKFWYERRQLPGRNIAKLCELGGNVVPVDEIVADLATSRAAA